MRDIESLIRQVTLDEYETGRNMFNLLRERGINSAKAAGIVYRAGCLDGKRSNKDKLGKEIVRLHGIINEFKGSPPEATAEVTDIFVQAVAEEGSMTDE